MTQYETFDVQYRNLLERILTDGQEHDTDKVDAKTGEKLKAKKVFHHNFTFDLAEHFPILTTKRMPVSKTKPENGFLFMSEIFWIWVMGSNDVQDLRDLGNNVWNEWELEDGTIGPSYGYQTRQLSTYDFEEKEPKADGNIPLDVKERAIDQVQNLIDGLINKPFGRHHIVNLWNVQDLEDMALPPCAFLSIWDVSADGRLNCHLVQRSGDVLLGVPFNVSQYAALVHMIAHVTGLKPGIFSHDITNAHLYSNHYAQAEEQMDRKPLEVNVTLEINPEVTDFNDYQLTDITFHGYDSHGPIKGGIAV